MNGRSRRRSPTSPPASRIQGRRLLALVVLCSAFLIDVMGATSVMAAAPSIGQGLQLSSAGWQWSLNAATLPAAALLLVGAWLADRFGRRRMLIVGLAGTMLSCLACGVSTGTTMFVGARVVLGASSALSVPAALTLLTGTFSDGPDRRRALAAWSALGGTGSTAGLLLGGLVTAGLGWRWVFLTSGTVCLVILLSAPVVLTERGPRSESEGLDTRSLVYFSAGIAAVLYAISQVPAPGRSSWLEVGVGAAGVGLLVGFVARQHKTSHPLLPPHLLRLRAVRSGNVTLLVAGLLVDGLLYALSLLLQDVRGYSALQFGAVAAVMTGVSAVAAGPAQRLIARFGARPVAISGLAGLALSAIALGASAAPHVPIEALLGSMALFGGSMGAAFVSGCVESLQVTDERDNATAGAVQNVSFTLGTTLGVALVFGVVASAGHLGAHPLATADPAKLLSGLRAALWTEAGAGLAGAAYITAQGSRFARRTSHPGNVSEQAGNHSRDRGPVLPAGPLNRLTEPHVSERRPLVASSPRMETAVPADGVEIPRSMGE